MFKPLLTSALVAAAMVPAAASAQNTWSSPGSSWLPGTTYGYVGASALRSSFDNDCVTGFNCDDHAAGFKVYTGGMLNPFFGLEVGYLRTGYGQRGGSKYRAQGLNFSVLGSVPIAPIASLFGKIGTTYGYTDTIAQVAGAADGGENGWGLSYGIGANLDLGQNWAIVAEWERHRFQFIDSREQVSMWSIGARYKF